MGCVQLRQEARDVNNEPDLVDSESTFEIAEALIGRKLDRRRNYMIIDEKVCASVEWTSYCTGCLESGDYGGNRHHYKWDDKIKSHIGSGCRECGYTGKVRHGSWEPIH